MKYHVTIAGEDFEIIVDGDDVSVNGRPVRAHLDEPSAGAAHTLRLGDEVHSLVARRGTDRGSFDIAIGGHRFAAEALDARAKAIRSIAGAGKPAGPAHLMAPMPGLIVRINVQAGDAVQPGQGLIVMEAMKMENELKATAAGTVKRVAVTSGSAVEKGALLLEME